MSNTSKLTKAYLKDLPNEILLNIFDYLSPIDIVRSFQYDLSRFSSIIRHYIITRDLNIFRIQSTDYPLVSLCLSIIQNERLNMCINENFLSIVLKSVQSFKTLRIILDTPFEQSSLSKLSSNSFSSHEFILESTSKFQHCQINYIDLITLLSSSVRTLVLRNIIFDFDRRSIQTVCHTLKHIRCILKNEIDLSKLLQQCPMLISIDIRLLSVDFVEHFKITSFPEYFRIEYPIETNLNLFQFPSLTQSYDQTIYSFPWYPSNTSLILRSSNPTNYLQSFPCSLSSIHQLIIECTIEPWSFEFVDFLRRTFPNLRRLYTLHKTDRLLCLTMSTADDWKKRRCTIINPSDYQISDAASLQETIRSISF